MKIEIVSGTKKDPPAGWNTFIKIDGKQLENHFNSFYFKVTADTLARYGLQFGYKPEKINIFKKGIYKLKKLLRKLK